MSGIIALDANYVATKKRQRDTVDEHFNYKNGKIGEGTYGVVYKATRKDREDGRLYALKKIKGTDNDGLSLSSCREISILRELRHENIVCLEEVYLDPETRDVWLLFLYAEHDLQHILHQHRGANVLLGDQMVKSIMHQILLGMKYLHDNWILHRDLKPANILVMGTGPEEGVVKIADLGMARVFHNPLKRLSDVDPVVVTIWYRAPELLLGAKHYTKAVDMWAIGCIFAELMTLKPIFRGQQVDCLSQPMSRRFFQRWYNFWYMDKMDKVNRNPFQKDQCNKIFAVLGMPSEQKWPGLKSLPDYNKLKEFNKQLYKQLGLVLFIKKTYPAVGDSYPKDAYDLLEKMLNYNPEHRLNCTQALKDDYFRKSPEPQRNVFAGMQHTVQYAPRKAEDDSKDKGKSKGGSTQPPPPVQVGPLASANPQSQGTWSAQIDPGSAQKATNRGSTASQAPRQVYGKHLGLPGQHR